MQKFRTFGSLVLISVMVALVGCGKKVDETAPSPPPNPNPIAQPGPQPVPAPKQPEPPKPASLGMPEYKLSAEAFEKEFSADKKAAEAKYIGKVVELSGVVHLVLLSDKKHVLVGLDSVTGGVPFCAFFFEDRKIVETLGNGQTIRLRGKCEVDRIPYRVYFKPSEIVEKGPDTIIRLTAEQIAKEYEPSPDAFEKKYSGKTLLVSGEVTAVQKGVADQTYMELNGNGKTKVQCYRLEWRDWKWPDKYKAGVKVRFIGSSTIARPEGAVRLDIDIPLDD